MFIVLCKSPDRIGVKLAIDALGGVEVGDKFNGVDSYQLWCHGVDETAIRDRLAVACQHPFEISHDDGPLVDTGGGSM